MINIPFLKKLADRGINLFLCCCGLVVLWLLAQVFCVASFHIPTDSMEPVLEVGDVILVDKLAYGARLFNVMDAVEGKQVRAASRGMMWWCSTILVPRSGGG